MLFVEDQCNKKVGQERILIHLFTFLCYMNADNITRKISALEFRQNRNTIRVNTIPMNILKICCNLSLFFSLEHE